MFPEIPEVVVGVVQLLHEGYQGLAYKPHLLVGVMVAIQVQEFDDQLLDVSEVPSLVKFGRVSGLVIALLEVLELEDKLGDVVRKYVGVAYVPDYVSPVQYLAPR